MTDVLLIEDDPTLRRAMARRLATRHDVVTAADAGEARRVFTAAGGVDVIVTDVDLPDGDGIELVQEFRRLDRAVGAVVATGVDHPEVAARVVESRVQGYLLKPFEHTELEVNVANAARWRDLERSNHRHQVELERLVEIRTGQVQTSRWETIRRLSIAAEYRDPETADHIERMSSYSAILGVRAGLSSERCVEIRLASPMHDIGKLGIPDDVLNFPGRFDPAQRAIMNEHTIFGWEILQGSESPLLDTAARIALSHHEWWDGGGYPFAIGGNDIPLEARIVAIADVFDALTSSRRYKPPFSVDETVATMLRARGTQFDPDLLDLFLDDVDELLSVRALVAAGERVGVDQPTSAGRTSEIEPSRRTSARSSISVGPPLTMRTDAPTEAASGTTLAIG